METIFILKTKCSYAELLKQVKLKWKEYPFLCKFQEEFIDQVEHKLVEFYEDKNGEFYPDENDEFKQISICQFTDSEIETLNYLIQIFELETDVINITERVLLDQIDIINEFGDWLKPILTPKFEIFREKYLDKDMILDKILSLGIDSLTDKDFSILNK
jgi:hypothetical protein